MFESFLLYLAFGCLAGILSGLFGIGGGVVIVPFLAWNFTSLGFDPAVLMIMAVATSLATIVITSISAVYAHHRLKAVDWRTVRRLSPGILLGSVLGSIVASQLPVHLFKLIFAVFLLFVAARMLWTAKNDAAGTWRASMVLSTIMGTLIGGLSSILGIGGGTLSVPFLVKCRLSMRHAIATSCACGFPIALAGSATYIVLGWHRTDLPADSLGYIHLPAFLGIISSSVLCAPYGAKLAHHLPTSKLKRFFAVILLMVGGRMLWGALTPL